MTNVGKITEIIENTAHLQYASEWDNVGLMIGSLEQEVSRVMVCLDVTPDVVDQAINEKCEMIISHHPLFFRDIKQINYNTYQGNMIKNIISNNITVYSSHTNMDAANGGINSLLAEKFKLTDVEVLDNNERFPEIGIGRIGNLSIEKTFSDLCEETKKILDTPCVRAVGSECNKVIRRLCVASGSCADLIPLASSKGADAVITSDVKYHEALEAKENGIYLIDAGHFPTENFVCDIFKNLLCDLDVEIITAKSKDVFNFI